MFGVMCLTDCYGLLDLSAPLNGSSLSLTLHAVEMQNVSNAASRQLHGHAEWPVAKVT